MHESTQHKKALVLSAGGMFGAYQAGAWKFLAGRFQPDVVIGASVGAVNGWAIAGGCSPEELIRDWRDPACAALTRLRLLRTPWRGFLDGDRLHARLREVWASFTPRVEVGVVAVELPRLRPRLFRNHEIGWEHLAASGALPFCYPQVRMNGVTYTDGGLLGALPLWAAAAMGATEVLAIHLLPQPLSRTLRALVRAVRAFAPRLPAVPESLNLRTIAPARPLGSLRDSFTWRPDTIERWIDQGYRDAERQWGKSPDLPLPS
ncbi:MAG: patatin-like phospholipase family protein [Acidobacteriota bacterium]